jgi:hypothetical protein
MMFKKLSAAAAVALTAFALSACAGDTEADEATPSTTAASEVTTSESARSWTEYDPGPGRIAEDPVTDGDYTAAERDAAADVEWQLSNIRLGGELSEDDIIRYARNICWGMDSGNTTLLEQMQELFDPEGLLPNFMLPKSTVDVFCPQHSPSEEEFSEMYQETVGGELWYPGGEK